MNPSVEEIIETAKTPNGEMVRTVTDLRLDKIEAKLAEIIKINEEYRAANKELYALASQASVPQPAQTEAPAQMAAAAAVPVNDPGMEQIRKAREDAMLNSVLADLGYKKQAQVEAPAIQKSQFNNEQIKDGM